MVILIFFIALFLRLAFLSPWLEDWDSVQFALALNNYSIVDHQPHPPGYPIYIGIGRLLNSILQDERLALTILSAITGAASVIFVYLLAKHLFNVKTAIIASILFMFLPVHWMLSEAALTNMPGLFFLLALAYLLLVSEKSPKRTIITSGLFGLMLSIRFTEVSIILALLIFFIAKHNSVKLFLYSTLAFMLGLALWLVPIIISTGPSQFIESFSGMANYIISHDALLGKSLSPISTLQIRINNLWYLLQNGYTAIFIILSFLSGLWIMLNKQYWKNKGVQIFVILLLAYLLPLTFIFNLEVTRYTLPLSPALAILSAFSISTLIRKSKLFLIIPAILTLLLFNQSFSQVSRFKQALPPTIAPVLFVKENFNPEQTIIIATFTYRQFQYYTPEFQSFYPTDKAPDIDLSGKNVIIDSLNLKSQIPILEKHDVVKEKSFTGDRDIFNRINSVTLYVLEPK